MAKAATTGGAPKSSLFGAVLPLLVLTVVAVAGGVLVGKQIVTLRPVVSETGAAKTGPGKGTPTTFVKELAPVITNLSAPEGAWLRLQAAIVYDKVEDKQVEVMASQIVDDTLAYMKTLTVTDLQGAAGLQHLREDLNERAALRSDGHVKEVIIEALVIE